MLEEFRYIYSSQDCWRDVVDALNAGGVKETLNVLTKSQNFRNSLSNIPLNRHKIDGTKGRRMGFNKSTERSQILGINVSDHSNKTK